MVNSINYFDLLCSDYNIKPNCFIKPKGLLYKGVFDEKNLKSPEKRAPIFEAFTNALESLKHSKNTTNPFIKINLYHNDTPLITGGLIFSKMVIEDNGIGFNEENFYRFLTYKDNSKGMSNKGSGRLQYLLYFNEVTFLSSYYHAHSKIKTRRFKFSKTPEYLGQNSLVYHIDTTDDSISPTLPRTLITFTSIANTTKDQSFYDKLTPDSLKVDLIDRYLQYFCLNRDELPKIVINQYIDNELKVSIEINDSDIPSIQHKVNLKVNYTCIDISGEPKHIDKYENFAVKTFKLEKSVQPKNVIKLTIKDEVLNKPEISFKYLSSNDSIDGCRYLFLVSSEYFNNLDGDVRGNISIPTLKEFKGSDPTLLVEDEVIIFEDLSNAINDKVIELYPEIESKLKEHSDNLQKLQEMFLLDPEIIDTLRPSLNINSTAEEVLKKVYDTEASIIAKRDADINHQYELLKNIDPASKDYQQCVQKIANNVTKTIPLQKRTALTHYIARRNIVLNIFDNILNKSLLVQAENKRNEDERLLHNLIFQQTSNDPSSSDLWIINEDFLYFKGMSEHRLGGLIDANGESIIKEDLTPEENDYRRDLEGDTNQSRPDILLFPDEGKCIIIEFKNPNVIVSEHLNQINNYASIILNLAKDKYKFNIFYGYLIGEKISPTHVRRYNGNYQEAANFDYMFLPSTVIAGENGKSNGSLYTEVISYSTLLKRARNRNEIFMDKLGIDRASYKKIKAK